MAGVGPAPKPAHRRARRNADPQPQTRLKFRPCDPPNLSSAIDWHPATVAWWETWKNSPMAEVMGETDWSFLLDTALLHTKMWATSQWTLAAEVRLRVAKFGATPEDRMRLRIQWADADERDADVPMAASVPNRAKYGQLRALPTATPKDED